MQCEYWQVTNINNRQVKGGAMKRMLLVFLGLMVFVPAAMGQAKDFPNKAVKVIVPYTAGSGSDTSARFFGEKLAGMLGQPFVVENKPGASGVLSVMAVKAVFTHSILPSWPAMMMALAAASSALRCSRNNCSASLRSVISRAKANI